MGKQYRQLQCSDRLKIEARVNIGYKPQRIADELGVHVSTIYRELKRGRYEHLNTDYTTEERYSPDIAQSKYRENLAAKGADLKIGADLEFAQYIENKIINEVVRVETS